MSVPLFHATCVAAVDDEVGWVVGFADRETDPQHYLQFQRAHTNDSQDRALGLDSYYVEVNDQSNSCYGGVEKVFLHADAIVLELSREGSRLLQLDKTVLITFEVNDQALKQLRKGLAAVFSGTDTVIEG